tara:strand:+ start:1838 stop:2182 length:345 start_codon:yes stop_codon:yes gene_type:complete
MAISYKWDVNNVTTFPTKDSNADVVYSVSWTLTATDGVNKDSDDNKLTSYASGTQVLETKSISNFIAFDSLDAAKVQGWVEAAMGADEVAAIKAALKKNITETITPTSVMKTLS